MKDKVKIVSAAIMRNGLIISIHQPHRHSDIINGFFRRYEVQIGHQGGSVTEGFLTSEGFFVNRKEALVIARDNGQLKNPIIGSVLTSEDLW